jgi:hypothetical protein
MFRTIALCSVTVLALQLSAQRNLEIGLMSGVNHYYGDLGNIDGPMQWNSTRPGMSITFRDFINNPKKYVTRAISPEFRLSWFRIGYDERSMIAGKDVTELKNYKRGLSFRNDLVGASGHLVLNAYREPFQPLFQQKFFMTFSIGLGVYHGRPKADLFRGDIALDNRYYFWEDGTVRDAPRGTPNANVIERDGTYETDLYSWQTESNNGTNGENFQRAKISPWHIAIPLGMGIRYMVTKRWSIGMEYCYMMFTTDLLDDVRDRYATYAEIDATYAGDANKQQLARYISDPTGWGTDGTESKVTSRRGNPGLLDSFSFISIEASYKFKRKPSRRSMVSL